MSIRLTYKRLISFSLLLFASFMASGQIDSLENELKTYKAQDSVRVNLLNEVGFYYRWEDYDKSITLLDEAFSLADSIGFVKGKAESLGARGIATAIHTSNRQGLEFFFEALDLYKSIDFKKGIADTYESLGRYHDMNGDQTNAVKYFQMAIDANEEINNKGKVFKLLNRVGWSYILAGKYPEAMAQYDRAFQMSDSVDDKTTLSHCYSDVAIIHTHQGNYPRSLEYFKKALAVAKENGDSISIGNALGNMGPVYDHLENYDKAIECYENSMLYMNHMSKEGDASNLNNLGAIYFKLEEYERAFAYLEDALEIYRETNNKTGEAFSLNSMGRAHLKLKNYKDAYPLFIEAREISLQIDNPLSLCYSYLNIGWVLKHRKQYDEALQSALKGRELAESLDHLEYKRDGAELLSHLYKETKDYKKAFETYQEYKRLSDSLFNKKNIEKITQIEYEYKYKQQLDSANIRELSLTKTVLSATQDLKRSQAKSFIAIIIILIISIISGGAIFIMKLRHVNAVNQNILIEQKLLRSQMTPHFIFNSLSVLQGMILNKEDKKSVSYLSKFSKLMRTILENSRHKTVALSKELCAINSYMELQNSDTNPPYNYSLNIDEHLDVDSFHIPPMLIQPFIENAIEHAFVDKKEDKKITMDLTFKDGVLQCVITDNGIGIGSIITPTRKDKNSLATTITSERLKMLSADFGVQGSVDIQNRASIGEQGTKVTLIIPYKIDSTQ